MKMPRVYTFDVPDFDDCGGRTTRRVEVPKAVFRQIEADVAAPLEATIHQLGENAAKAAGALEWLHAHIAEVDDDNSYWGGPHKREYLSAPEILKELTARAALTEPSDG